MDINITKGDIVWSYLAQFFNLMTGLITLPLMLKMLSPEEVGFNYILISINSIVVLFDMGFSGQFSRYITYAFSGAQEIYKEGISDKYSDQINEGLVASIIIAAKKIYIYISLLALVCLLTLGSFYVYDISIGFTIIPNASIVWCMFCLSAFFNIYYLYLNAFLQGKGLITEVKKAQVCSRICQISITFGMLFCGFGLLSVVTANLIAPFIFRFLAHRKFYTPEIRRIMKENVIKAEETNRILRIIFHNAKKIGIVGVFSSAIGYASTLVVGKYMTLADVGSYGLMVQLVGVIMGLAAIYLTSIAPELAAMMIKQNRCGIRTRFGLAMFFFGLIGLLGFIALMIAPIIFERFRFNTRLPSYVVLLIYFLYKFIEQNQSMYSQLFLIKNDLRFYPSAVITGIVSFVALWATLARGYGLGVVIIAQAIPLLSFSAWKWPLEATREFGISTLNDLLICPLKQIKSKYEQYF